LANGEKYFPKTLSNLQVTNFGPVLAFSFHGWSNAKNFGDFCLQIYKSQTSARFWLPHFMVGQWRKTFASFASKFASRKLQPVFGLPVSPLANGEKLFQKTLRNIEVVNFGPFFDSAFHGLKKGRFMGVFSTFLTNFRPFLGFPLHHSPMAKNFSKKRLQIYKSPTSGRFWPLLFMVGQ
jgi:hypothetical protein